MRSTIAIIFGFVLFFGFLLKGSIYKIDETPISEKLRQKLNRKLSHLTLSEIPITKVLEMIGTTSKINLVASNLKPRLITLSLHEISFKEALISIFEIADIDYSFYKDMVFIAEKSKKSSIGHRKKIFVLKNFVPSKIAKIVKKVFPDKIQITPDDDHRLLVVTASDLRLEEISQFVQLMDQVPRVRMQRKKEKMEKGSGKKSEVIPVPRKKQTRVVSLFYGKASELKKQMEKSFGEEINISGDDRTNQLILIAYPELLLKAEKFLKAVDKPVPQILIEARLIEVSASKLKDLGIKWGGEEMVIDGGKTQSLSFNSEKDKTAGIVYHKNDYKNNLITSNNSGSTPDGRMQKQIDSDFTFSTIRSQFLSSLLTILETKANATTISRPKIMTQNLKMARINVGSKIPIKQETIQDNRTVVTYKFTDTGISLDVTPQVHENNYVTIKVIAEVSSVGGFTPVPDNQPIIRTKRAETMIRIHDGDTIAIAGLLDSTKSNTRSKNPFFGDLPLLGNLFKSKTRRKEKSELIIFITSKIVFNPHLKVLEREIKDTVPPGLFGGRKAPGIGRFRPKYSKSRQKAAEHQANNSANKTNKLPGASTGESKGKSFPWKPMAFRGGPKFYESKAYLPRALKSVREEKIAAEHFFRRIPSPTPAVRKIKIQPVSLKRASLKRVSLKRVPVIKPVNRKVKTEQKMKKYLNQLLNLRREILADIEQKSDANNLVEHRNQKEIANVDRAARRAPSSGPKSKKKILESSHSRSMQRKILSEKKRKQSRQSASRKLRRNSFRTRIGRYRKNSSRRKNRSWKVKRSKETIKRHTPYYFHTFTPGDSLQSIAQKYGVSLNELMLRNRLAAGGVIFLGQKLKIKLRKFPQYRVVAGDSLLSLAQRFSTSEEMLLRLNNKKRGVVNPGDILILPINDFTVGFGLARSLSRVYTGEKRAPARRRARGAYPVKKPPLEESSSENKNDLPGPTQPTKTISQQPAEITRKKDLFSNKWNEFERLLKIE
ncbi:LysM peptidoglycan-binding domain-containing protein [Candidatus Riflebacteria bacterium]